ncbi:MAG: methyltransferase [Firmicutes bacterium]|nr:methyltransferase [Bacillota bacterium]
MGEQYYTVQPQSKSAPATFRATLLGHDLLFATDHGVFSRTGIDYGTRVLLDNVHIPDSAHVLDLGCGYGPVGIAVARAHLDALVWMSDVNERAVELARANVVTNRVADRVQVLLADGTLSFPPSLRFDLVVLNPPVRAGKATVYRLFAESRGVLAASGRMYVVLQKKQGAESAKQYLASLFRTVETVARSKGYFVFCCEGMAKSD